LKNLKKKFDEFDLNWRKEFSDGFQTPLIKRSAIKHAYWMDHEVLRQFYHHDHEIDKNVFRSNQPSPERIKVWGQRGIKTIINFRGETNQGAYFLEKEACKQNDIDLINFRLFATKLPPKEALIDLEAVFKSIKPPFLMHCKSGSDRAGLGAALYFLYILKAPIELAQKQLSLRYLHIGGWTAGILDYMLMQYRLAFHRTGINFKDWLVTDYDIDDLTIEFKAFRKKNHIFKTPR
jgi:protein tyrosine/serine phosphatase